jgi:AcrR family transcriptional regulator
MKVLRKKKPVEDADEAPRDGRKQRTRRALMDAALTLLEGERSFSSLSLREVAKVGGVVPAAFYRHFGSMEDLGLALVDDAFAALHALMRDARTGPQPNEHLIANSVHTFLQYADTHRLQFQFIAKERMSGSTAVRLGIRKEIRLWVSELAADLSPFPPLRKLNGDTLRLVAGLVVQTMMGATELLLDADPDDRGERTRLESGAAKQLTLIFLGAAQWAEDA